MGFTNGMLAAYLSGISIFSTLNDKERELLANETRQITKNAGQVLLHAGEFSSYVYVLTKGSGVSYFLRPGGKKFVISHIKPDRPFGIEVALLDLRHNSVTEITEHAEILAIPVLPIKALMESDAAFSCKIARHAMDSSLRHTDYLKDLSFGAQARLSRYLFRRALEAGAPCGEGVSFDLGLRKSVLADYLCIAPETLSRTFSQLQDNGIITVESSKITVSSIKSLVQVSEGFHKY